MERLVRLILENGINQGKFNHLKKAYIIREYGEELERKKVDLF